MKRREFFGVGAGVLVVGATGSFEYLTPLTVENVEALCDKMLPESNKCRPSDGWNLEDYANLIESLDSSKIDSLGTLADLIRDHLPIALKEDKRLVRRMNSGCYVVAGQSHNQTIIRKRRGVFFLHVGLVRVCMRGSLALKG